MPAAAIPPPQYTTMRRAVSSSRDRGEACVERVAAEERPRLPVDHGRHRDADAARDVAATRAAPGLAAEVARGQRADERGIRLTGDDRVDLVALGPERVVERDGQFARRTRFREALLDGHGRRRASDGARRRARRPAVLPPRPAATTGGRPSGRASVSYTTTATSSSMPTSRAARASRAASGLVNGERPVGVGELLEQVGEHRPGDMALDQVVVEAAEPAEAGRGLDAEHARVDDDEPRVVEVGGEPLGRDEVAGEVECGHVDTLAAARPRSPGCRNRP